MDVYSFEAKQMQGNVLLIKKVSNSTSTYLESEGCPQGLHVHVCIANLLLYKFNNYLIIIMIVVSGSFY